MGVLDDLIVSHLEDWLTPEGLADLLGNVLVVRMCTSSA